MRANNVQEFSVTIGVSDILLGGSSQFGRTFSSQFATGIRFKYVIDDEAGNFEIGTGYLSSATTLVRESPEDGSTVLPVNFGAGTKQVFVAGTAHDTYQTPTYIRSMSSATKVIFSGNIARMTGQTNGSLLNRYIVIPFKLVGGFEFDAFVCNITTASIGGTIGFALYDIGLDGQPDVLLVESSFVDSTVTGMTTATFIGGSKKLPPGFYGLAFFSKTSSCFLEAGQQNYITEGMLGAANNFSRGIYQFFGTMIPPATFHNPFGAQPSPNINYNADPHLIALRST